MNEFALVDVDTFYVNDKIPGNTGRPGCHLPERLSSEKIESFIF
jgi:hypothetical protein